MSEAAGSANSTCPRCGGGFHCGAQDSTPCPCGTLTLSAETTRALQERYLGCLCLACLAELRDASPTAPKKKPTRSS